MENLPLVTIGAINYNNAKYVVETLESIKNQSYPNIELVIVDDCSTDNSVELIKNWLKEYQKPYKFIIHEKNFGICATCNSTLRNATGKYYNLIATDDIMMPDKIRTQVSILEKSEEDECAVYSDAFLIKEDGSPRYGWFINRIRDFEEPPRGIIYQELMKGNFIPAMSLLIKISAIKKVGLFDEELPYEDYDMWLRLAREYRFIFSDYVSTKYRVRKNGLAHTIKHWDRAKILIYSKHVKESETALNALINIAQKAYISNDKVALKLLKSIIKHSNYIKYLIILSKLPLYRKVGIRVLNALYR